MRRTGLVLSLVISPACGGMGEGETTGTGAGTSGPAGTSTDGSTSDDETAGDGGSTTGDGGSTTGDGGSTTGDGGSTTGDGGSTTGDGECRGVGPWPDAGGLALVSKHPSGYPLTGSAASVAGDGRFVAYHSAFDSTGEDDNGVFRVYVYDALCDTHAQVPFAPPDDAPFTYARFPSLSADAQTVAFVSSDADVSQIWVYHSPSDTLELATVDEMGEPVIGSAEAPRLSADGHHVVFVTSDALVADDTNNASDVYVYEREVGAVERISVTSSGEEVQSTMFAPSISGDGRFVVFESFADFVGGVDTMSSIWIRDRDLGTTDLVSALDTESAFGINTESDISANGRFVVWRSGNSNLVPDDNNDEWDVYLRDLELDTIERVSLDSQGSQLDISTYAPRISGEGEVVVMLGESSGGGMPRQVWVKDRASGEFTQISHGREGEPGDGDSTAPAVSLDGGWVAFASRASNLVPDVDPMVAEVMFMGAVP